MKFHLQPPGRHTIAAFGHGWVRVGATEYRQSILLDADRIVEGWGARGFAALIEEDFLRVLELAPEIVLLGTGVRQRFPHPRLFRALTDAGIVLEAMDTGAACRTFNILSSEDRRVAAALLLE